MGYRTIEVSPIATRIGAVVEGVDLRATLPDEQVSELRQAIAEHLVLFLRNQDVTAAQQLQFASYFGTVNRSDFAAEDAVGDARYLDWLEDDADKVPSADLWHTDRSAWPAPPDYAILNCIETPAVGGDTLWLSLYAVYDGLSPVLQRMIDHLKVDVRPSVPHVADVDASHKRVVYEATGDRPGSMHPLVRVHPVTGRKAVYLCGFSMYGIEGMHPNEAQAFFDLLRQGLHDPGVQCRWRWQKHDLVIWDERCTNHRALSDHYPEYRKMRRCTAGTSVPIPVGGEL
jgi:taurine dioxygenase